LWLQRFRKWIVADCVEQLNLTIATPFPSVVLFVSHDSELAVLLRRRLNRNIAHEDEVVSGQDQQQLKTDILLTPKLQ